MADHSDSAPSEAREWLVDGRVQGVGYRASTRARALELGVAGFAENLTDGRVRVIGIGPGIALDRFAEWLREGPTWARVSRCDARPLSMTPQERTAVSGFATR